MLENQYPIGNWMKQDAYSFEEIKSNIDIIAAYPAKYKSLLANISEANLAKTYRQGAWNVRQLVVHVSDMHILHYARFKQALCDENPAGFVANINAWNNLDEVFNADITPALMLLEATHARWVHLMNSMKYEDFDKTFFHPLRNINLSLAQALSMGAWHTQHHYEHIRIALESV